MGLDIEYLARVNMPQPQWAYSGFNRFRTRLAADAGLGDLSDYKGFGGSKNWPSPHTEPLVYLLNHSDCEGRLHGDRDLANRLREVVEQWPEDDYDRMMAERLAVMLEKVWRDGGVVDFQ